ncbi:MAG: DUF1499 domain-containing protein [Rhodothermales bacterium]|nr:DUF1499 domain-containing protein [Rhodothermales bacterium]
MFRTLFLVVVAMSFLGCTGTRPPDIGVTDGRLADCPSTPNCVSSDADPTDEEHYIDALDAGNADDSAVWEAARAAVEALPRTEIITESDGYLYAESTSRMLRFVDDVELHWRPASRTIAVRSASRIGRSDFGVNRKRVEQLRTLFKERLEN